MCNRDQLVATSPTKNSAKWDTGHNAFGENRSLQIAVIIFHESYHKYSFCIYHKKAKRNVLQKFKRMAHNDKSFWPHFHCVTKTLSFFLRNPLLTLPFHSSSKTTTALFMIFRYFSPFLALLEAVLLRKPMNNFLFLLLLLLLFQTFLGSLFSSFTGQHSNRSFTGQHSNRIIRCKVLTSFNWLKFDTSYVYTFMRWVMSTGQ